MSKTFQQRVALLIAAGFLLCIPAWSGAQSPPAPAETPAQPIATEGFSLHSPHWELTLDGQVGIPSGHIKVGERDIPGTELQLHGDLGIAPSEAVGGSVAYHFTSRDALRLSFVYFFLRGGETTTQPIVYNGQTFPAGHVDSNLDFYRLSLAYERVLVPIGPRGQLIGSVGLTYVYLNAVVGGNPEDFYKQELPIPIFGLRLEYPVSDRLNLVGSLSGGALPRVNSGRQEGGTVYLQQSHADLGLGVAYLLARGLQLEGGYHLTYFTQHETSHEDDNAILLLDHGFVVRLTYRF